MLTVVLICHVVSQVATVNCHDCGTSTVQLDQSDCQVRLRQSTLATVDSNRQEELSDGVLVQVIGTYDATFSVKSWSPS